MTKLWLIRQTKNNGYDTYDSAVVAAPDERTAKHTHPDNFCFFSEGHNSWVWSIKKSVMLSHDDTWTHPKDVTVEYLGDTDREISGVILASFNAG